ncbi:IS1182 family transposase ISPa7 [subsurface metagenome]
MDFIKGFDRNQLVMMDFESNVAYDSWARVVDWFVDALPMKELGFNDVLQAEGRPPYKASDLLKLFMYGYKKELRTSRKLEAACKLNIEVIWLLKGLQPSARKIAYFRKNNPKAFKQSFRYFVVLLKDMDLISGETIAIDSFKIRAQNSLKNNFNQKKIDRHLDYIDNKIAEYEQQLDENDELENNQKKEIEDKIQWQQEKKKEYQSIEKELKESGESQISKTDPDAKSVILHRNVVNVGYNVQAGCDGKYKLFINNDTGAVNDTHALANMALDAKALLGVEKMNCLTDKGYTTGVHIDTCSKNNITTYSSPKAHSSQDNGLYNMNEFVYDVEHDTYTCPANQVLRTNGNICKKRKHRVKRYYTKACDGCKLREMCTKNKMGRFIERSIYQEALEENEKRVNENPEYYRQRQQITEHQFGTLKQQWGFTFTLMKGKEHVLTEVNLMMMCYNLRRLMSILGVNTLRHWLKMLYLNLLWTYQSIRVELSNFFTRWNNYKVENLNLLMPLEVF